MCENRNQIAFMQQQPAWQGMAQLQIMNVLQPNKCTTNTHIVRAAGSEVERYVTVKHTCEILVVQHTFQPTHIL
jgi:hypothetical protein